MNLNNGYIKLPRNFFEDDLIADNPKIALLLILMMTRSAYCDTKLKNGETVLAGQVKLSLSVMMRYTGSTKKEVRVMLKKLEDAKYIENVSRAQIRAQNGAQIESGRKACIYCLSRTLQDCVRAQNGTQIGATEKKYNKKIGDGNKKISTSKKKKEVTDDKYVYDDEGNIIGVKK